MRTKWICNAWYRPSWSWLWAENSKTYWLRNWTLIFGNVQEFSFAPGVCPAAGLFGNPTEQVHTGCIAIVYSDRVNQYITFADEPFDLLLSMPAVVIAPIGNHEERLAALFRFLDLA